MSGKYIFFHEGFFGFGEAGNFKAFSLMHFIPILLCIGALVLVWKKRDDIAKWEGEKHFRFALSVIMFFLEFSYYIRLLYIGDLSGNYMLLSEMPLDVCDLGIIVCIFMITSKYRFLFGVNFYVSLFGATLACILPQMAISDAGPAYFRYYQFFGAHLLPIFCTIYMMMVHKMKPRYKDIWISFAFLLVLLFPALKFNKEFTGFDYLFMRMDIPFIPSDLNARAVIYSVLVLAVFHIMWFVWSAFDKKRGKDK